MLKNEDLLIGAQVILPSNLRITLVTPVRHRQGSSMIYEWIDAEGFCWNEDFLLEHGCLTTDDALPTEALTAERKSTHGDWAEQSRVFDNLMYQLINSVNWSGGKLNHMHRASLTNIAQKMSRICTGDPTVEDHWNDIQGYAYLGKGGHK